MGNQLNKSALVVWLGVFLAGCQTQNATPTTGAGSNGQASSATGNGGSSTGNPLMPTTGTSGGTTGGLGPACGDGLRWFNDQCAALDCSSVPLNTRCFVDGGALGFCEGARCTNQVGCGGYGVSCPPSYLCEEESQFEGGCVDGSGNRIDCMSLGASCPGGTCLDGLGCVPSACEPSVSGAPCTIDGGYAYGVCCGTSCVAPAADPRNCGNCGITCSAGQLCLEGKCEKVSPCDPGQIGGACPLDAGVGNCCDGACIDSSNECPDCAPGTQGAYCAFDAGTHYAYGLCCGGCVDAYSDPNNCGACGRTCGAGSSCQGAYCPLAFDCSQPESSDSYEPCALDGGSGVCCGGACVAANEANCGACGATCEPGTECFDGEFCFPDGGFNTSCETDAQCGSGLHCASTGCLSSTCNPARGLASCAVPKGAGFVVGLCCGSQCADLTSDAQNCAQCGWSCGTGTCLNGTCHGSSCGAGEVSLGGVCAAGSCVAHADGQICAFGPKSIGTCCGGRCVDTGEDPANCGSCGTACDSGICFYVECADLTTRSDCLQSCPPYTVCKDGACLDSLCEDAIYCADSSGGIGLCCGGGECADPANDPLNCGGCGIICTGGTSCVNGVCGQANCSPAAVGSYCGDAGNLACCPSAGCTNITSDDQNCGYCGDVCPAGQRCENGSCR